jgi:hypothetical protein
MTKRSGATAASPTKTATEPTWLDYNLAHISSKPRWCIVKFIEDNVVHVNDDASQQGHWMTACGLDIMDQPYSRAHPQMVSCLECLCIMGPSNLYLS